MALYKLYLAKLFEQYPEEFELSVKDARSSQCNLLQSRSEIENHSLKDGQMDLIDTYGNIEFQEKQEEFDNSLSKQAKFLRNFMKMFESLLLFVRATRQKDWELHLTSLNGLVKYFFAHDLQNYARMVPVYLSEMFAQDPELWEYFKQGNFSVNKTRIPFSAIGADHGIEHENRAIKVMGGIKGITNNKEALYRFALVTPEINLMVREFCIIYGLENKSRDEHYQLSGSASEAPTENVRKVSETFEKFSVSFEECDNVLNLVTKAVLPDKSEKDVLERDKEGEAMFATFSTERLAGDKSIWEKMSKRNLLTFKSSSKTMKIKLKDKIIQLKEERNLMTRFIIASRMREGIDLPALLGKYEFSVAPRSMFSSDGRLLHCTDKSNVMHAVENLMKSRQPQEQDRSGSDEESSLDESTETRKVIILDGMAIVQKLKKTKDTKHAAILEKYSLSA